MRTPIRKPGKYTHQKVDPSMTRAKYDELKLRLESMKKKQPALREEVKRLATDGDFSENAAYQIAKGRLRGLNQRVLETENLLKRAEIIEPRDNKTVQLGHFVTVEINGKTKTFQILGSTETNPNAGVISHNSPIGSALIGKKVGETVSIQLANREVEYKIIKISN